VPRHCSFGIKLRLLTALTFCELEDSADFSSFGGSLFFGLKNCRKPFCEVWDGVAMRYRAKPGVRLRYGKAASGRCQRALPLVKIRFGASARCIAVVATQPPFPRIHGMKRLCNCSRPILWLNGSRGKSPSRRPFLAANQDGVGIASDRRSNPAASDTCHQCCANSIASAEEATQQSSKANVEHRRSRCELD